MKRIRVTARDEPGAVAAITEALARERVNLVAINTERMGERVDTLEAILDAETPDWRKRHAEG